MEYRGYTAEITDTTEGDMWAQSFVDDKQVGLIVVSGETMELLEENFKKEIDAYIQYKNLTDGTSNRQG